MLERELTGDMALLYAERFGRDVVLNEVLVMQASRARALLDRLDARLRASSIKSVRIAMPTPATTTEAP